MFIPVIILAMEAVEIFKANETDTVQKVVIISVVLGFTFLIFAWMILLKLETTIDELGISAYFKGIPFAKRIIPFSQIKKLEVITYEPLFEYGGWGVRFNFKKGWCYNVSGNKGLLITYKTGKTFLVGTQRADELTELLLTLAPTLLSS